MTSTNIISALVKAMGPGSVKHVKSLAPAVIATLGDSKVYIIMFLNLAYLSECTLRLVLGMEHLIMVQSFHLKEMNDISLENHKLKVYLNQGKNFIRFTEIYEVFFKEQNIENE